MKNNLKAIELWSIITILIVATFLGVGIHSIIKASGVDAYIAVLITAILGIPVIMMFLIVFNYEPDLSLNLKTKKLYGKKLGIIINISFCILAIIVGISLIYNLISFTESQFLSNTPPYIIGLVFISIIIYINTKGIETITRVSFIIIIINTILFSIAIISLIGNNNIDNLKPVLENGLKRPFDGALRLILLNIASIFILTMIPKNRFMDKEKTNKAVVLGFICSMIVIFFVIFSTISTLGIDLASIYQYPEYMILKEINLFNFLNRIENLIVLQWLNGIFISTSFVVYFISNNIKNNNKSKIIPSVISISLLFISLKIFRSNTDFNNYSYNILPIIRIISFSIFLITVILIIIKKIKNKEKLF